RESSLTVGLNTLFFAGVAILPLGWLVNRVLPEVGQFPHLALAITGDASQDWAWLLLIGVIGMCAYILLSRAYQVADASLVAPFDYTYLPIAAVLGYVMWGEVPPISTFIGMVVITGAGLYLGFRELRAMSGRDEPALVGETVFPPASIPITQIPEDEQPAERSHEP
ncbi:MAG: DMT family transporter, partial [Pseudomonadota bacterium]